MRGLLIGMVVAALVVPGSARAQRGVAREDVTFRSGELTLAGTLYRPRGVEGPTPGIVLIHGSGAEDRSSLRHFAEIFAREGVAALAYDKRGVGKSQGPELAWRDFDLGDLAADAAAGVAFLRSRRDVDSTRVGLFGVSQGGWVAPLAATHGGVSFLVLVSASVTTIAEDNRFERAARLGHEGFGPAEVAEVDSMHLVDLEVSRSGARFEEFQRLWERHRDRRWFRRVYLSETPMAPDHRYRRWYRTVMDFDPVPVLERLEIPALWLYGDPALDRFAPVGRSIEVLEGLRSRGKRYEVHTFPGADHSLQEAGGKDAPYRQPLGAWLKRIVLDGTR